MKEPEQGWENWMRQEEDRYADNIADNYRQPFFPVSLFFKTKKNENAKTNDR